jgi:azurin
MNKPLFNIILVALFFTFVACGGGGDTAEESSSAQESTANDVRTINIIGVDDMKFVVASEAEGLVTGEAVGDYILLEAIEVAPGEEIQITLTTVSNLPPTAMSHNFAVLEMGTDVEAFWQAALQARDNEYISPEFEDQVIVATDMLGNGETDTVTFTAPEETGEYDYLCTFPGHYTGGMYGKLIVKE